MVSTRIRVLLCDDHELVRRGLHALLDTVHLAEKAVKNYVSNILMKLDLFRRAEVAAFMAKRRGPSEERGANWP